MRQAWMLWVGGLLAFGARAESVDALLGKGTPEEQGQALSAELARRNAGFRDLTSRVEMLLTDADGAQARRAFDLKLLERATPQEGERSLIVFQSPADVKGTAVLSHARGEGEDEQWIFLPSARRTTRISAARRTGAFMSSEFSFEDLTGSDGRKYRWKFLGKKTCSHGRCLELESVPKDPGSAYARRVLLVDEGELLLRTISFFDRKGQLLKTLSYDDYVKLDGRFFRSQKWTMKNAQTGKSTAIQLTATKVSTGLTGSDFSPARLGN
jgi:Outer membrane lipoprotein-sorting protein